MIICVLMKKHLRISLPNVEVGDIIDFDTKFTNTSGFSYPIDEYINEDIPTLNSTLTLKFRKGLHSKIATYNGMSLPLKSADALDSIFSWNFPYLQAEQEQIHSIPANELPYIRYMMTGLSNPEKYGLNMNYEFMDKKWRTIFKQYSSEVKRDDPRPKKMEYYQKFLYDQWKDCGKMSSLQKLEKVISFINGQHKTCRR